MLKSIPSHRCANSVFSGNIVMVPLTEIYLNILTALLIFPLFPKDIHVDYFILSHTRKES